MLDIAGQIQEHFFIGMCLVLVILSVIIMPLVFKAVENMQLKKLEKDLKRKYGDDCFSKAS